MLQKWLMGTSQKKSYQSVNDEPPSDPYSPEHQKWTARTEHLKPKLSYKVKDRV